MQCDGSLGKIVHIIFNINIYNQTHIYLDICATGVTFHIKIHWM